MKRRRHATALPLDDQRNDHANAQFPLEKKSSSFGHNFTKLLLRRRIAGASALHAASLGLGLVAISVILNTSQFKAHLRLNRHKISDRDVCLRVLQLMSKRGKISGTDEMKQLLQELKSSSSQADGNYTYYIEYKASRGLGHRLTRAAAAYHLANRLGVTFRQDWGQCPKSYSRNASSIDIWEHLFGKQKIEHGVSASDNGTPDNTNNDGRLMTISNEVPGYKPYVTRHLRESALARSLLESNMNFYRALRSQFIAKNHDLFGSFVSSFDGQSYLDRSHHTVIGLHVRAGNGETGEFVEKHRMIENLDNWIRALVPVVARYIEAEFSITSMGKRNDRRPLIFLATDTPSAKEPIREEFAKSDIAVVFNSFDLNDMPGPSYLIKDRRCVKALENQLMDMVLLSLSDIIIAGRYSSFTQTMPLTLLFSDRRRSQQRNKFAIAYPYCESGKDATSMACFRSYQGWVKRNRKDNEHRIVYNNEGVLQGNSLNVSNSDGHEDALAYPMASKECLKQSKEYYFRNRKCLEAHLLCAEGKTVCT